MKRILLAANPHAGLGRGRKVLARSLRILQQRGVAAEVLISECEGHLLRALPRRLLEGWDQIVALGGDGTLFQVINCCLQQPGFDTPLALIPAGTGNSFARELAGAALPAAWEGILSGEPTRIDVLHCLPQTPAPDFPAGYYCLTALGLGFVSDVTRNALHFKRFGVLAYVLAVMKSLAKLTAAHLRLQLDGRLIEREGVFVIVCNSRFAGGLMKIAPGARLDDGLMEVLVLHKVNRRTLLRAFPSVFKGTHVHHPNLEIFSGRSLQIAAEPVQVLTPDGEVAGCTPVSVTIQPQKLPFLL
ncbi:MAG: diacylglycerol kinase family lipid kinase [candidate division KSB1 bacterium]|nr:diacylglycerol kinase family lipid kinase [candidate division KSB1 bacterium]MDZ7275327.1 diacylglycerol kinase family lipid kinase [candidate division KSB1 bacterium]MDZ7287494.1 diacylglycerol kinase family lipid kinase [candidate division KSB1 bacterium]MDZ7299608.1 diacylglycerol kinase family lipid kinase [candidate division KSB1 bacterium]MDZ7307454.1 diacylglycerol kinase family lipid kinase [candidate division KSB1 bacterium]